MSKKDPLDVVRAQLAAAADKVDAHRGVSTRRPTQPKRELTRQIVKSSNFDRMDWAKARREQDIEDTILDLFRGDVNKPEERPGYFNAPELMQDLFMAFFRPVPTLHKKQDVVKDARLNGKFIEQMMALTDYERLHDNTATDPMLSRMATVLVGDAVKEMIRQHREAVEQANQQRQEQDSQDSGGKGESWDEETPGGSSPSPSQDSGEQNEGGAGEDKPQPSPGHTKDPGGDAGDEGEQDAADEPQPEDWDDQKPDSGEQDADGSGDPSGEPESGDSDAQGGGEGADGDPDGQLDDGEREFNADYAEEDYEVDSGMEDALDGADLARFVNTALKKAADDIGELEEARKGVGLDSGEWKMMDPVERLKIAERLNTPRMRAIADLVGRFKREAMNQQAQKVIDAPREIVSVEMGKDLPRVLLSEYAYLGHPATKVLFYLKYVNGRLFQWTQRGRENVGKGPVIALIDNSGSMKGSPENWAKGFAEALRRICQEQERDFHAIYFGTNGQRKRFDFPMGKGPFEQVMAFLSIEAEWGTEFDGVLTEGLNKCQTMFDRDGKGKADIVFITDGQARLDQGWIDQFVAERDRIDARIFGIYISARDSIASSALQLLHKFCTAVIPVKALAVNDEAARAVFRQV